MLLTIVLWDGKLFPFSLQESLRLNTWDLTKDLSQHPRLPIQRYMQQRKQNIRFARAFNHDQRKEGIVSTVLTKIVLLTIYVTVQQRGFWYRNKSKSEKPYWFTRTKPYQSKTRGVDRTQKNRVNKSNLTLNSGI
jgi:hypothetical protein